MLCRSSREIADGARRLRPEQRTILTGGRDDGEFADLIAVTVFSHGEGRKTAPQMTKVPPLAEFFDTGN